MGHSVHPRFCGQPPGSSVFLDDVCKGCKGAVLSLLGRSHLHHRPVRQTFLWNKPGQAHRLSDELLLFKIHVSVVIKPSQGNTIPRHTQRCLGHCWRLGDLTVTGTFWGGWHPAGFSRPTPPPAPASPLPWGCPTPEGPPTSVLPHIVTFSPSDARNRGARGDVRQGK